ncbi:MAG TPA: bifunctional isocitrate dehydrogenase kinase/phosphatase [Steroidobacteraceae bacterium]|nr:bifunctional isocitrate dehydrogenase kinase/phosphatase [Steroidobacteraceae bacterium]HQR48415.1 bifunctional isocitrate dehydrogenase kinase/phosphatase [Steroidobacteraceae bacterium]
MNLKVAKARTRDELIRECAQALVDSFADYNADFRAITQRARQRFEDRDWRGSQRDAVERIDLYRKYVAGAVEVMRHELGDDVHERAVWSSIKRRFAEIIDPVPDSDFPKTFFSSVTRQTFGTVGVDPAVEFVALDMDPLGSVKTHVETKVYVNRGSVELLVEELLADFRFRTPYRDFDLSVRRVSDEIKAALDAGGERRTIERLEVIKEVFYQMTRAYLVGRISGRDWTLPFVVALRNCESGVLVDAIMLDEPSVSVLFSYTRSYFHVDLAHVGEVVRFLKEILPRKWVSELYTVLGRAKQGKTERFRELFRHLQSSDDQFVLAPGEKGLVMVCFTLPSFDVVFKVIRDNFPDQKNIQRQDVLAKYDLVFKHDRAGRLVDAQEYKLVKLPRARFAPDLLEEMLAETANTVHEEGDDLVIGHMYVERRMTPLNLYVRTATRQQAEKAVLDYGQCIRDLAVTNIFPGDLLLKNFGVTRNERVIFYDYDELCLVTDCRFREIPEPSHEEDEMRGETWYYVGDNDVFPETFIDFLGFDPGLKQVFLEAHREILTAEWWRGIQERLREGDLLEVLPYHKHRVRVFSSMV